MQWVGTVMMHRRHTRMETAMDQKIFSKFTWKDPCNGQTFDTYIEPLASSLRSPFFQCFNQPKDCYAEPGGCQKYGLSATSFLLMTSGQEVERIAPGNKRFFFDLGSTSFDRGVTGEADSFKWFKETFQARGVIFDQVFAWEAKQMDHRRYWSVVPDDMQMKIVFYNYPAIAKVGHSQNPLTHVKLRTRPEDYVVFKLDIDKNILEEEFIRQIMEDPELYTRIDELFWEHHVWNHPLANVEKTWWRKGGSLIGTKKTVADSYAMFTKLRKLGIKAHSWV